MDLTLNLDKNSRNQRHEGLMDCHFLMVELRDITEICIWNVNVYESA
jgi:hypothetical protein